MCELFRGDRNENDIIALIDSREDKYELVKTVDMNRDTLLMRALYWSDKHTSATLVEYLLRLGSDLNHIAKFDETPLGYACRYQLVLDMDVSSTIEIISLLLSYGADTTKRAYYGSGGILYRCALVDNRVAVSVIVLHGVCLTDREHECLLGYKRKRVEMLVEFYDNMKLSRIAYTHIKRLRYRNQ
jgi:ankyrin repeat protein